MAVSLGSFEGGMKIRKLFSQQFRRALQNGAGQMSPAIDLASLERDIDLGTGITHDEFRLFEAE